MIQLGPRTGKYLPLLFWTIALLLSGCLRVSAAVDADSEQTIREEAERNSTVGPAILLPTAFPSSTPLAPIQPSATPLPAVPRQLTENGCCPYPIWLPDSRSILILQQETQGALAVVNKLNIETGEITPFSLEPGYFSPDFHYRIQSIDNHLSS